MHLRDSLNYLSKLNWPKIRNGLGVVRSYYHSRRTKSPVHRALPVSISIEPTTACNLGCPECPSGLRAFTRETGNLRIENFKRWIDELAPHLTYINFYFQGEPYIHPQFLELVKYADEKKIYTATSTNAHFLDAKNAMRTVQSGLDRLIISIDGTTQEVYGQYRVNGRLEKVLEGTRNIIAAKRKLKSKTPHVIFQFLVVKPNEHQVGDVKKLARQMGVDEVRLKTAQVYNHEHGNALIPDTDKFSRYRKNADGTYSVKNALDNHCWRLWSSCVITWDGLVVPCCFDKDAQHRLGDLKKNSFREIWNNDAYKMFRTSLLKARSEIGICSNCSEGTKVWA